MRVIATGVAEVEASTEPALPSVARLTLGNFRSYAAAQIEVAGAPVVLAGPNGAGKTNLLEAISFLAPGRGLRRAKLSEIDRRNGGSAWTLSLQLATAEGMVQIGTGRDAHSESGERRVVRIDGAPAKTQAELAQLASLVWLTPQMDRLFTEGAGARRRFLDRLVLGFDPEHANALGAYERAMRERLRLLRDGPADASWLGALEETMAAHGVAVAAARRDAVMQIDRACAATAGPFPQARLAMAGEVESWLGSMPALAAEDALRQRLAALRRVDAEAGVTTFGPHRSDLAVEHVGNEMPAPHCSTGEQKALLLAILLAQARLLAASQGAPPLMLLDEVAAHLDAERRAALFAELLDLKTQAWLTGTDAALFAPLRGKAQFFAVADARLSPMDRFR
ncbi:MAG TPA: DNA replication/repair protein RecF [Stellaceae bacterium]|nr:DNA replication/repair protein RecF [Stellaceae bacterium]